MSTDAPCAALQSDSVRLIQLQRRLSEMTLMKCVCKLKRKQKKVETVRRTSPLFLFFYIAALRSVRSNQ